MSFNRTSYAGTNRSFFWASSKSDIAIPMHNVKQSDKFSSQATGQTIVTFETTRPVQWSDARDLIGHGAVVTMCKAPIQELDGAMFGLMVDALRKSDKWVHTPGVQPTRTFFKTVGLTTTVSPVPTIPGDVTNVVVARKLEKPASPKKREREVIVISDDDDDKYVARLEMTQPVPRPAPLPETQVDLPETQVEESQDWL